MSLGLNASFLGGFASTSDALPSSTSVLNSSYDADVIFVSVEKGK